jgi:hypothetical protein
VKALSAQLAPLRSQVTDLEAPYRARLTEAKRKGLEKVYRDALDIEPKKRTPEQKKLAADAQTLIKVTWDEIVSALTSADREKRTALRQKIHALEGQTPPPAAKAWTIRNDAKAPATYLLKRGDARRKLARVQSAFPRVLVVAQKTPNGEREGVTPDRLALAKWLTKPDHPLTARVMVNRIWQHHFGRGIVATPNDFGFRGAPPTHPELLDWLACEFVRSGWSIKHLHRLIVLSSTYQQSSQAASVQARKVDPDNRLLWRWQRRRLEGEALRDHVLAVAGTLNRKVGGPMIRVPLEPEVYQLIFTEGEPDGLWHAHPDRREYTRRSIYLFVKRNVRMPLFEAFDQPDTLTSCPVRSVSTFAPQALILLNGPFMQQQSKALAVRLLREAGTDSEALVRRAYQLALARPPRTSELTLGKEFLASQTALLRDRRRTRQRVELVPGAPGTVEPAAASALADFCLALLNSNEFLYVK